MVVTKQEHYTDTAQQVILYAKKADTDKIAYPLLQGAFNPGFSIPEYDEIELSYTSGDLTGVVYKLATVTVGTLTLSYTDGNLTGVVKS